jgi:hypothetical protein
MSGGRYGVSQGLGRQLAKHFGEFFHQIKVRQQIGRKDSVQAVCLRMWRLEGFLWTANRKKGFCTSCLPKNVEIREVFVDSK